MKITPMRVRTAHLVHDFSTDGTAQKAAALDAFEGKRGAKPRPRDAEKNDLPDPSLYKGDQKTKGLTKIRFTGPLFRNGVSAADVVQGALGDCFCPSGTASVAHLLPKKIQDMIKDNGDGTYTFAFKKWNSATQRFRSVPITVDGDLWVRADNDPLYGDGNIPTTKSGMEMWFPLFEKAYAVFCGKDRKNPSYNSIGNGGNAEYVIEAILGRKGFSRNIPSYDEEFLWREVTSAIDEKRPLSLGTYSPSEKRYSGTGLHGDHSYSVLGYKVDENGDKFLIMRNPWGESEPGDDGKDDGVFPLPLAKAYRYFQSLGSVR